LKFYEKVGNCGSSKGSLDVLEVKRFIISLMSRLLLLILDYINISQKKTNKIMLYLIKLI